MRAFIFDTETTGLIENRTLPLDKQPEIIEFYGALVNMDTGEIIEEIDTLITPKGPVSKEITKITGITPAMVENKQPFGIHTYRIECLIEASDAVIAHNLSFDMEMVDIEFSRMNLKVPWPRRRICTVEATVHLKGFRLNLSGLHQHLFGEPFSGAHRAKVDVDALTRCSLQLFKDGII